MIPPTVTLPGGETIPRFGIGTWRMGERAGQRQTEIDAIRLAISLGVRLIDTAEMYGEGGAEEAIARAIDGMRDALFIVSKVYPHNASRKGTITACERSLKRLCTDRIDLYLLHWRGSYPLADTVGAFNQLRRDGKIRYWGVSNLDTGDMRELASIDGGDACVTNQVLYNLARRGPEFDLLPWQRARGITTMAYSPLDQARMLRHPVLATVAKKHAASAAQVALAWLLRFEDVITIPKAVKPAHVRENFAAIGLELDAQDLRALDDAFPRPSKKTPLDML
ncbi:MAG: aldo/keto reductase [Burkholderiales bacterium]